MTVRPPLHTSPVVGLCNARNIDDLRELTDWFAWKESVETSARETNPARMIAVLFESTDRADHMEAAKICAVCPAKRDGSCERAFQDALTQAWTEETRPEGTWAGKLRFERAHRGRPPSSKQEARSYRQRIFDEEYAVAMADRAAKRQGFVA